jgi:lipid A 3-O-deacylase
MPSSVIGPRRRVVLAALCVVGLGAPADGEAQTVRDVEIRVDNDNFNFWKHRDDRGDHEYTHGMHVRVTTRTAPWWGRLAGGRSPCGAGDDAPPDGCLSTTWEGGQRIFTPRTNSARLIEGERPWAGWLYGAATAVVEAPAARHSARAEIGVTGRPSLAGTLQQSVHDIAGFWEPRGWHNQLPFEPGVLVGYGYERRLDLQLAGAGRVAEIVGSAGASAGNVLTAADAGVEARIGVGVPARWGEAVASGTSIHLVGGVRGEGYLRNLFLDGSTWTESPSVEKEPFIRRHHVGFGMGHGDVELAYIITTRTRAYRTEPSGHRYSSFILTLRR